jgi:hypothetical protein
MLRLRDSNQTPPDKFTFLFPDGHTVHAFGKDEWREKIVKYATDNNYAIPTVEQAEDQLCKRLSGEWCVGGDEHSFVSHRFTFDDFLRGMKTLGEFVVNGEVVSQDVAESRTLICSRCVHNVSIPGCSTCVGLANAVVAIKGAKSTKHDHLMKVCSVCLCSNEAQAWVPPEILAKSTTPEMTEKYKRVPMCWKNEIANLTEVG